MRVGLLCGAPPQDTAYLDELSELVELTVHCSSWVPWDGDEVHRLRDAPFRVRTYRPVVRSPRGHLHFVYRGLRAHVAADAIDLLHVTPEPWGLLAQQASTIARHGGTALVLHGCDNLWHHGSRPEQFLRRHLARRALSGAAAYAAENAEAIALAIDNGLPAHRPTAVIHTNPRDPSTFRPAVNDERSAQMRSIGVDSGRPLVGFIGRTSHEKGIDNFIGAIEQLNEAEPRVAAIIGGHFADDRAPTKARAERAGIRCLGSLRHPDEVAAMLRAIDVLCVPSLETPSWKEQGPRIVIEALMSGATVVGTDTAGIRGLLDGAGHLTEATPGALAAGIQDALMSRRNGEAAVAERRAQAIGRFGPTAVAAQLHDLWGRAMDEHARRGRPN